MLSFVMRVATSLKIPLKTKAATCLLSSILILYDLSGTFTNHDLVRGLTVNPCTQTAVWSESNGIVATG